MAILYSINTCRLWILTWLKKKKKLVLIQKKRKRSSSNIQAQIVSQTYLQQQIKTKTEGEWLEKQQNNCTTLLPPLNLHCAKRSFTTMICLHHNIWRSSHRVLFTSGSLFPGGSAEEETQKQRCSECAARLKVICKRQGHVESVTARPSLAPPTGTGSSSQGRRCTHPTCRLNQTHWIEREEKGGMFAQSRGEKSPALRRSRGPVTGELVVPSRWSGGANLGAGVTRCHDHVHSSLGEKSRADKEIARGKKKKPAWAVVASIPVKWPVFIQWPDHSEHFTLRDYIITKLCWERNY